MFCRPKKKKCRAKPPWLFPVIPFFFFSRLTDSKQELQINSSKLVINAYSLQACGFGCLSHFIQGNY